jgi:hypothetical protein
MKKEQLGDLKLTRETSCKHQGRNQGDAFTKQGISKINISPQARNKM